MQITEQIIERIARKVFNALFPQALRSSNVVTGSSGGGSVQHAVEADHATTADSATTAGSADAVAWSGVSDKPDTATRWPAWGEVTGKPSFATVATSGSYTDLSNKPSIPSVSGSVSGSTLTITINGTAYSLTDTNTWRPLGTGANDAAAGNHNHDGTYLKLSGGTLTGTLKIATGYGISDATDNGMLCYHPADWTGVSSSQWGVGAIDSAGVIRSSDAALKHYRYGAGTYDIIDSKGGQTIENSLRIAQMDFHASNEINCSYGGGLHLQYSSNYNLTLCCGGGNVGIGTTSPSYKLHVAGTIYATGGVGDLSDIRKKDVITYEWVPPLSAIADAPIIRYTMKDDEQKRERVGSVAQYWQKVMPEAVNADHEGTLSMLTGDICLVNTIALAREVKRLKEILKRNGIQ